MFDCAELVCFCADIAVGFSRIFIGFFYLFLPATSTLTFQVPVWPTEHEEVLLFALLVRSSAAATVGPRKLYCQCEWIRESGLCFHFDLVLGSVIL